MTQPSDRMPALDSEALSPAQQEVFDAITAGPRGAVAGPLRVWLQSPELASKAQALGRYARFDSSLPPRLSELAILVTARVWGSDFEWGTHAPIAREAGVPGQAIEAIAQGRRPDFSDDDAAAVFDFAVELHLDRFVSDATFERARRQLGPQGVVDLVGICGYYTLISMTINAFQIPAEGMEGLPPLDGPQSALFRPAPQPEAE